MILQEIIKEHGTPTYVYDAANIRAQYDVLSGACPDAMIAYAVKSNTALAVIKILADKGAGADIVSGGELIAALRAGAPPNKIIFSGVGKTDDEISAAIDAKIAQINIESAPELDRIEQIADQKCAKVNVAFRLNPDVGSSTLDKITTGRKDNKFGILEDDLLQLYAIASKSKNINVRGVSVHIGSQILELNPFENAFKALAATIKKLRAGGLVVKTADLGGGVGIAYSDNDKAPYVKQYGKLIEKIIKPLDVKVMLEPGRFLVGACGKLLTRVVHVKHSAGRRMVILDAGMSTLVRPAMYGSFHDIKALNPRSGQISPCDIVGPICESSDVFAKDFPMPPLETGDLLAIQDVGAHGSVLASNYNMHTFPAEVLIDGNNWDLIKRRQTVDDILSRDKIPNWL